MTLVEPRQQGKTSLINRLNGLFATQDYVFAYADLTTFDRTNEGGLVWLPLRLATATDGVYLSRQSARITDQWKHLAELSL